MLGVQLVMGLKAYLNTLLDDCAWINSKQYL